MRLRETNENTYSLWQFRSVSRQMDELHYRRIVFGWEAGGFCKPVALPGDGNAGVTREMSAWRRE
jgi:hypothetical protein